jgi:3-hydroxyisobutyrate dehydrogenase-like beta-hydroxyacid dehydrogenase
MAPKSIPESIRRIALIGFGEAGGILGEDFATAGFEVRFTDILLRSGPARQAMLEKARKAKVSAHDSLKHAVANADVVISAVSCSAAVEAAAEAARTLTSDQIYLDINSVSPEKKRVIAATINDSGANFVEAAVMAPFPPQRLKVPMLFGGSIAGEAAQLLRSIGLNATAVGERVGVASAIKMCRSIVIKGLEALAVESLFAARRYGAEEEVLKSLAATFPEMGWHTELPDYLISRVAQHGRRRAAEMLEVAETLKDKNLDPMMALATAERQDWLVDAMAAKHITYRPALEFSWRKLADGVSHQSGGDSGSTRNEAEGAAIDK